MTAPLSGTHDLFAAYRQLRAAHDAEELFARAAGMAQAGSGFTRAVVLHVQDGVLVAGRTPLADPASDALRRDALRNPIVLRSGSAEANRLRRPYVAEQSSQGASPLAEQLGLGDHAYAPVAPEGDALALLVVDRDGPAVTPADELVVDRIAVTVAIALENVVLQMRAATLAEEVRQFAGNAQALAREVLAAPTVLPGRHGLGSTFTASARPTSAAELSDLFSPRERTIAGLLAEGRTNREIAEALVLSTETVKSHVSRILRKLDADNRVEAAARYLGLVNEERRFG